MNKALKYATNGALIFGIGNAAINVFQQLNNQNSNQKFDWLKLLKAFENGVLVGGTGGFAIGLIRDNKMSKVITSVENVSKYLTKTLNYYKDDNKLLLEKAEKVRKKLDYKFNKELANYPNLNGSITKDTSIYGSDIDIQIPFKRDFGSIENVYYTVSDFIFDEFQDTKLVGIREQKHSIGLEFNIGNEIKRIDVIPLRQIDNNSGDTYLYVNNTGFFEKPTYKKTNYLKQLKKMQFSTNEKKIIRLLKVWKVENNLKLKSIHIEFLVKKAFEKKPIPYGIEKCLLETINFLAENIMLVKIIDPANTNNIISNSLTFKEKESISEFCYKMIENITQDERNIIDYFPSLESKILNF